MLQICRYRCRCLGGPRLACPGWRAPHQDDRPGTRCGGKQRRLNSLGARRPAGCMWDDVNALPRFLCIWRQGRPGLQGLLACLLGRPRSQPHAWQPGRRAGAAPIRGSLGSSTRHPTSGRGGAPYLKNGDCLSQSRNCISHGSARVTPGIAHRGNFTPTTAYLGIYRCSLAFRNLALVSSLCIPNPIRRYPLPAIVPPFRPCHDPFRSLPGVPGKTAEIGNIR